MGLAENKVTDDIKDYLESLGNRCWFFKHHSSMFTRVGIPDIIGCLDGKFFAIEVKAGNGRASEAQKIERELITEANGIALIVWSVDEVRNYLF